MIKDEDFILSNGVKIPKIGFGTWQIAEFDSAYTSTIYALKAGIVILIQLMIMAMKKLLAKQLKILELKEKIFLLLQNCLLI